MTGSAAARIDHLATSGTFSLDGQTFDVDNNVWIVGNDSECIVLDAPHDAGAILAAIGDRRLLAVLATHAHDDHVREAPRLADRCGAPVALHPDDLPLWRLTHPDRLPEMSLTDGQVLTVAGTELHVLHTPGHSPGSVCVYVPALGTVLTGDTLFAGGPGATGRSFSDYPTIVTSITERLLALPPETLVLTGHGDSTRIGDEAQHRQEWTDPGS